MTQDEIIRMAREAGFSVGLNDPIIYAAHERFAALVAAHEREACAKVCEELAKGFNEEADNSRLWCAAAIRARGENGTA